MALANNLVVSSQNLKEGIGVYEMGDRAIALSNLKTLWRSRFEYSEERDLWIFDADLGPARRSAVGDRIMRTKLVSIHEISSLSVSQPEPFSLLELRHGLRYKGK